MMAGHHRIWLGGINMNSRLVAISCDECGATMHMDNYDMMALDKNNAMMSDLTVRTVMCPQCHKSTKIAIQATFANNEEEMLKEIYGMMDMEDCQILAHEYNKIYGKMAISDKREYERVMPVMYIVAHNMRLSLKNKMIACVKSSMVTHDRTQDKLWHNFIYDVCNVAYSTDEWMGI